jgi:hypothetical protein
MPSTLPTLALGVWLLAGATATLAQAPLPPQGEPRELIFCAELMSPQEREAYRVRMRAARSWEEREALRAAHRHELHLRAQQRGVACEPWRQRWRGGRGG